MATRSQFDTIMASTGFPVLLRVFGEPVTLPDTTQVSGIFDPRGDSPDAAWPEIGAALRMSQQGNPILQIIESAASGLSENDRIGVRDSEYIITRIDLDGAGMARIELMPADRTGAFQTERWQ